MDKHGRRSTYTGRIIYDRKLHQFSGRDAARVTRKALSFLPFEIGETDPTWYAHAHFESFLRWSMRFNFWPLGRLVSWEAHETQARELADRVAHSIASYLAVPSAVVDVGIYLRNLFMGSEFEFVLGLDPNYAKWIAHAAQATGTINMEDIYGRKKRRGKRSV
jgi:hypothetical protein